MDYLIFLISSVFIALFLDLIIFSYLHELAHKKAFKNAGIKAKILWNLKEYFGKPFQGESIARCYFNDDKFQKITIKKRDEIFLSGLRIDLKILGILSLVLVLSLISMIYLQTTQNYQIYLIILSALILTRIFHLRENIFGFNSDIWKMIIFERDRQKIKKKK